MKNKKAKIIVEIYGLIGKALCASAGGIIGFILGGPLVAVPGIFVGAVAGHMLEKTVIRSAT